MTPRRILIVDDDVEFLEEIKDALAAYNFDPISINDSSAVQEVARLIKPDAILLDVKMAGLSGFQVKDRLSQDLVTARIPVIAITGGYGGKERRYLMNTLGVESCILKPVALQELITAIDAIIAKHSNSV